ncbi:MAG: GNAT family N-acetyltransferase [Candidatus Acidiferrales bacterium]
MNKHAEKTEHDSPETQQSRPAQKPTQKFVPKHPTLETPRLLLRPLELADAEQIQILFPHWEIVRYLRNIVPWPYPPDGALQYVRSVALPAVERGDAWHWTLRLKTEPDQMIGFISLMKAENENRGFWMGLPWQGLGLMTEACDAVTGYWFDVLKFPVLRAPKATENAASRRISEKQGMRVVASEERDYVSGRFPGDIWEITAGEWRKCKGARH